VQVARVSPHWPWDYLIRTYNFISWFLVAALGGFTPTSVFPYLYIFTEDHVCVIFPGMFTLHFLEKFHNAVILYKLSGFSDRN
jgi:hypothetical protein